MSSRLFQEVREKRGLAYAIYSFLSTYADAGVLGIYLATNEASLAETLTVVLGQMAELAAGSLSGEELDAAREQIKGGLILGLESSDRRMGRQAKNEIYFGREVPIDEVIEEVEAVTLDAVIRAAGEAFRLKGLTGTILGPATQRALPAQLRSLSA
jgi:predicted Zn-dependent peptidase